MGRSGTGGEKADFVVLALLFAWSTEKETGNSEDGREIYTEASGWSEKEKRNECTMSFLSRLSYSCILALLCLFRLPMLSHVPMHWCPRWHIKLLCPQQANIGSSHAMPKVSWMPQMALSRSTSPGFRQPSCWIWTAVHVCRVNSGGRRHDAGGRGWLGIPETQFLTCCD
jgi:hypothetical protein